ncbi:hypothetical protein AMATHDRAFT_38183 [Amanita thiersii Skay4041]|uniref:Uncharacterized protein n=1 Tax=Amanita thiersii Skay4041 TaxID=703135 RepID=A0A2A9P0V4_9AGAR|nr:hypothetical protein AMATHDRAFT_38183 [Amanita thiersii Skay4041]
MHVIGVTFLLLSIWTTASAQVQSSAAAKCASTFDWARNRKGHDPCTVASYLKAQCDSTDNIVKSLPQGGIYLAPDLSQANNTCLCSSPVYSLLSACALCQAGKFENFPEKIPRATSIPMWAYLNVSESGTYDVQASRNLIEFDLPELEGSMNITGFAEVVVNNSTGLASDVTTSKPSNEPMTAAIGGLVGALAGSILTGIGVALHLAWRRRRLGYPRRSRHYQQLSFGSRHPTHHAQSSIDTISPFNVFEIEKERNPEIPTRTIKRNHSKASIPTIPSDIYLESEEMYSPARESSNVNLTSVGHE